MGVIKSALELALEKTEGIKSDKKQLQTGEIIKDGRRIAVKYLNDPENADLDIKKQLDKEKDPAKLHLLKKGVFEAAMSNLVLPADEDFETNFNNVEKVLSGIIKDRKKLDVLFKQLKGFFSQFLENREKLQKSLESQYAPRLKQKEEQLAKQMGRKVKLTPAQDPEFVKYLAMNLSQLEEQYQKALDQAKEELKNLIGE